MIMGAAMAAADDRQLLALATAAGTMLQACGWRVAVAESCTGGWIAKALTDVAGSSGFFTAGFTTYSNESKQRVLGVPEPLLARHGAVSEAVVAAMAQGALRQGQAELALATSGVAGPSGGSAEKPVGLVWFGLATAAGALRAECQRFQGDREAVRRQAVAHALRLIAAAAQPPGATGR